MDVLLWLLIPLIALVCAALWAGRAQRNPHRLGEWRDLDRYNRMQKAMTRSAAGGAGSGSAPHPPAPPPPAAPQPPPPAPESAPGTRLRSVSGRNPAPPRSEEGRARSLLRAYRGRRRPARPTPRGGTRR